MTLGVDASKAKWMLAQFYNQHRSKSDLTKGGEAGGGGGGGETGGVNLSATFCVAGERKDPVTGNAQMQLRLVREDKVEEAKKKLSHCFGAYIYR